MRNPELTEILADDILTVRGLFTPDECAALVRAAEDIGFGDAPVTTGRGFVMMPEVRNNTRVMLDDRARAAALWQRLAPWVPLERAGGAAVGLNERLRYYRYAPGQYFRWHRDGAFYREERERSLLTAMVYLNDDFEGGSTDFDVGDETLSVKPERGLVLLFEHRLRHQGAPVVQGRKYVLRTDVMYRWEPDPRSAPS